VGLKSTRITGRKQLLQSGFFLGHFKLSGGGAMKLIGRLFVVGLVLTNWVGVATAADPAQKEAPIEVKVKPEDLPKAVSDALKARFPGLTISSAAKETENGNVVFDIELTQKGRKFESDVKEDGTMLEVEKEVDPKNYPKALAKSVDDKYRKAKITIVMEVNVVSGKKETPDHLEVSVETADKLEKELLFQLDGKTEFKEPAPAAATEPSDKIEVSQLPKPVSDAVKKKYPKAEVRAAEKGDEDGKTVFEISITNGKDKMDVTIDPAGKILLVEKEVAEKDLPKTVLATAKAKHPQGTVKLCEELWKDDKLSGYEVTIETPDKKTAEVEFNAVGKEVAE
jgi:uncharacterized membrane protein YkoI